MKMKFSLLAAFVLIVSLSQKCSPPKSSDQLKQIKSLAFDSARNFLIDSITSQSKNVADIYKEKQRKEFKPEELLHNPPDDGHVHDGGFGVTSMISSQEYVTGVMDRVIDEDHNVVVARIPFVVKKGLIKQGDDYISDKKKHAHIIEYDLVDLPTIDPATGLPTGQTIVVAIVKKVRPK